VIRSSLSQLQTQIVHTAITGNADFDGVSTDSRKVVAGNLFVALRGDNFDAHAFLQAVAEQGAAAVIAERVPNDLKIPAIIVPDTRVALGEIARYWRRQFTIPVIGVAGSNGKTTVKEMIASILAAAFEADHYLATRGNLNNEIGVPLTVCRLDSNCHAAVIELGMNHPGEIAFLASIAQPVVGLVNNAQREHQEFMASVEAVAQENGAVIQSLPQDGVAVFPSDDMFTPLWREYAGQRKTLCFGLNTDADVTCTYRANMFGHDLQVTAGSIKFEVKLSAVGTHNVRNALAAIACTLAIGVKPEFIQRGLESFVPANGRLQKKKARNGAQVIDDTYNANPDSVRAAIDVLAQVPAPRIMVLGDMGEVGDEGPQFHEEIGAYARTRGINHLLTLGNLAEYAATAFGAGARHQKDIGSMHLAVDAMLTPEATVLVKGSRFMKMERVVQHLQQQPTTEAQTQESH
jgi:UDP-N-acetylmuramoyl-tripeptide--D-alanyl-D-alanine ligase